MLLLLELVRETRLEFQLIDDALEVMAFDDVELLLEVGQDFVRDVGAGVGAADVVAHLEVGDADRFPAFLHREPKLGDVKTDLRRVPRLGGVFERGQCFFELARVGA